MYLRYFPRFYSTLGDILRRPRLRQRKSSKWRASNLKIVLSRETLCCHTLHSPSLPRATTNRDFQGKFVLSHTHPPSLPPATTGAKFVETSVSGIVLHCFESGTSKPHLEPKFSGSHGDAVVSRSTLVAWVGCKQFWCRSRNAMSTSYLSKTCSFQLNFSELFDGHGRECNCGLEDIGTHIFFANLQVTADAGYVCDLQGCEAQGCDAGDC